MDNVSPEVAFCSTVTLGILVYTMFRLNFSEPLLYVAAVAVVVSLIVQFFSYRIGGYLFLFSACMCSTLFFQVLPNFSAQLEYAFYYLVTVILMLYCFVKLELTRR